VLLGCIQKLMWLLFWNRKPFSTIMLDLLTTIDNLSKPQRLLTNVSHMMSYYFLWHQLWIPRNFMIGFCNTYRFIELTQ
jgi:hypothetical protein